MSRYNILPALVNEIKPSKILDIGVWDGENSVIMIKEAQKYNPVEYYGFDLFAPATEDELSKPETDYNEVKRKLDSTGAKIVLVKGNTRETLWETELPKMDFVFIDGGHSLETIANDWNKVKELMNENTVVLFDDYYEDDLLRGAKATVDSLTDYKVEFVGEVCTFGDRVVKFAKVTK